MTRFAILVFVYALKYVSIHLFLQDLYRKVGSYQWLKDSHGVCEEILAKLEKHIQKFNNLDKMCCQV